MSHQPSGRRPDQLIAGLARRQHGVVARGQLLAAGISGEQVVHRLRTGRLHCLHRGVYLVGHAVPPRRAREMAALLACGKGAVVSHGSAAAIWELLSHPSSAPVCVTVPPGRTAVRPGVDARRAALDARDVRQVESLRVTSPARTILDLAADLPRRTQPSRRLSRLEHLVAEAFYRGLANEVQLRNQIDRNPRRRGVAALRGVLDLPGGPRRTRSAVERSLLRLLRLAGIAGYEVNARVHGYEVDFLWRDRNFAVELDGYTSHSGPVAFERDRLKIATLKACGLDVMPVTARQLRDDPQGVRRRLIQALELAARRR